MRIAIVTDAWSPQVNGVVTTLQRTGAALETLGHTVCRLFARSLDEAAARYCAARGLKFTTSYHTQFPQYVRKRLPVPESLTYALLRRHHSQARRTLAPTEQQRRELVANGFRNVVLWSRGVDTVLFRPRGREHLRYERPIAAYLGRVALEKNLAAFLDLDLPGTKVVIGDGPARAMLERHYPHAVFLGFKFGVELAQVLSSADVLVFPSRTDTFGLVLLEAMACGTPAAAYPVTGPIDVVEPGVTGVLDEDLGKATRAALSLDREGCRRVASTWTWERASAQFFGHLVRARDGSDLSACTADEGQGG